MKIRVFGYYKDGDDEIFSFETQFIPREGEYIWVESLNKHFKILDVNHFVNDKVSNIKALSHTVTLTLRELALQSPVTAVGQ